MTHLLWIRTSRGVATLDAEIADFMETLANPLPGECIDADEPFEGDDHLLIAIRWQGTIQHLKATIATTLKRDWINDWSLTEVGMAIAPRVDDDEYYADYRYSLAGEHFGVLNWNRIPYGDGATGLWVDLDRERKDRDQFIMQVQRLLPSAATFMWHGRSSILLAYRSPKPTTPFGASTELLELLSSDEVAFWIAFQIGNWSVGGVFENMNPMADFIWRQRRSVSRKRG